MHTNLLQAGEQQKEGAYRMVSHSPRANHGVALLLLTLRNLDHGKVLQRSRIAFDLTGSRQLPQHPICRAPPEPSGLASAPISSATLPQLLADLAPNSSARNGPQTSFRSSGRPTTAASATLGCATSADSIALSPADDRSHSAHHPRAPSASSTRFPIRRHRRKVVPAYHSKPSHTAPDSHTPSEPSKATASEAPVTHPYHPEPATPLL